MRKFWLTVFLLSLASICVAQNDAASFATELFRYRVDANFVYHTANNYQNKLDVYRPAEDSKPTPVVVVIHGGGWVEGTKEERVLEMMPYLQMGFAAVNVEYRLGRISLAPAAVEDCRCALHWVFANAKKYNFDPSRVLVNALMGTPSSSGNANTAASLMVGCRYKATSISPNSIRYPRFLTMRSRRPMNL